MFLRSIRLANSVLLLVISHDLSTALLLVVLVVALLLVECWPSSNKTRRITP